MTKLTSPIQSYQDSAKGSGVELKFRARVRFGFRVRVRANVRVWV